MKNRCRGGGTPFLVFDEKFLKGSCGRTKIGGLIRGYIGETATCSNAVYIQNKEGIDLYEKENLDFRIGVGFRARRDVVVIDRL